MTAEEKSNDLIERFLLPITQKYVEQDEAVSNRERGVAKQCALIAVEEILNDTDGIGSHESARVEYWQQVKSFINKQ